MSFHRPARLALALCLVVAPSTFGDDKAVEFFETKIRPVLVDQCYSCHSAAKKQRGGLTLDTKAAVLKGGDSGPALTPGQPKTSLLVKALRYEHPDVKMPPSGKLSAAVIADFERWIADGAIDPRETTGQAASKINLAAGRKFWSFQPPVAPKLPDVKNVGWVRTPIDRFVLAKLEAESLTPAKKAERRELIRRATFDVTGLPPTPEEVEAFVADPSEDAFTKVVDRLLNSPHYGERWGRHWLDVARYAEDQAHTFGVRPNTNAFRYRDWVVAAINADMPYDQFVKLQIAADLIDQPDAERSRNLAALGFFGLGAQYYKNTDAAKAAADELDDRVDTLTRGFLGLTVSCARCHDHKYDPIPQQDYYSLAGVFQSCKLADVQLASKDAVAKFNDGQAKIKKIDAEMKSFTKQEKTAAAEKSVGATSQYLLAVWKHQIESKGAKKVSVADFAAGQGLSKDKLERFAKFMKDPPKAAAIDSCRQMLQQTQPDKADAAAKDLQRHLEDALAARKDGKLEKQQTELLKAFFGDQSPLAPSDDELRAELSADKKQKLDEFAAEMAKIKVAYPQVSPATAHGLAESSPKDMKVFLRGNPAKQGDVAPRRFLRALAGDEPPAFSAKASGRLELANAIGSRDNPLTARVIVNRIWQRHFGRGIVGTPSNFGELGDRPTHPELLDYLAVRLMEQGWSLRAIHREIMLSTTYQLSAEAIPANLAKDADNRWLWRRDRARLDIECWRDAMLAVSGKLDDTIGGPTFNLSDASVNRRTVYARISRHNLDATLRLFDFPDANITSEKRTETTVPQQQLFALNSPFVVETAKTFAARVQREASNDDDRIRRAFALAFGRPPVAEEISLMTRYLNASDPANLRETIRLTRWERLAQGLLASNEFTCID